MFQREMILGGAPQAALDTGTAEEFDAKLSEAGVVDLSRGLFGAVWNEDLDISDFDLAGVVSITSLEVNGTSQRIKGDNTPAVPNFWDPCRLTPRPLALGTEALAASNDVSIGAKLEGSSIAGDGVLAFPFRPASARTYDLRRPGVRCQVQGSPTSEIAAAATGTAITITFDDSGIIDLAGLFMRALFDDGATNIKSGSLGALAGFFVTSIKDPDKNEIILGTASSGSTVGVSAQAYRHNRPFNWADHGLYAVSSGQTVVVTVDSHLAAQANVSMGVPFWQESSIPGGIKSCRCK